MPTVDQATDETTVLTSGDGTTRLRIVDHAVSEDEAGAYLTAYTKAGDDWLVTVDYFKPQGGWNVYVRMGDDTVPVTASTMADVLAAHEDAQGIADHLNAHEITRRLNEAATVRRQLAELTVGRILEVTI